MLILLPLGMMNITAMAVIAILIFAEKALPGGMQVAKIAAVVLIAYGALAIFVPIVLPMMM